ncbi:MAG: Hpt domain-containing protein, partial [Planctomycetaceae bacterium]|nr:Hpt domain-containing protein [Planctomycetaceae bacterium]
MNDMSLILEFVQEAREYIDEIEPTLIEINNGATDAGTVDSELINSVFRLFHSMKGSAGFLALTTVTSVTHEAETLLDKIRNGKSSLTVQITATLCKALDLFREMLVHIEESGNDEGFTEPAQAIIAVLKKHVAGEPVDDSELGSSTPSASSSATPTPSHIIPVADSAGSSANSKEELSFEILANEPVHKPISAAELDFSNQTEPDPVAEPAKPVEPIEPVESAEPKIVAEPVEQPELVALQLSPEMRHGFVAEATEQLDAAEQALLLVLDENVDSAEPLKDSFRYIHSFKGNCGFMGLVHLEHLSHTMETLLDALRNGEIKPDEKNVGKLLSLLDVLRDAVKDLEEGGSGTIKDLNYHIRALNALMGQEVSNQVNPASSVPSAVPLSVPNATTPNIPASSNVSTSSTSSSSSAVSAAIAQPVATPAATSDVSAKQNISQSISQSISPNISQTPLQVSDVLPNSDADHIADHAADHVAAKPAASAAGTQKGKQDIRVDLHKLDILINLVGELVIAESMVTRCPAVSQVEDEYYNRAKHQLRRICDDLQDVAMAVRMIPLSATFRKMIRLVHDLATKSGKKIKLNLVGEETEVDKTVIEQIADPLVHIVRNSCDHGIELPEDRIKSGKPETGTVTLEGKHEGGEVWIMIT